MVWMSKTSICSALRSVTKTDKASTENPNFPKQPLRTAQTEISEAKSN